MRERQLGRASVAAYLLNDVQSKLNDSVRAARSAGATYSELRAVTGLSLATLRRIVERR